MIRKAIFLGIFFFLLILLQTSFFAHFSFKGMIFNVFLLTTVSTFFFLRERYFAVILAIVCGFYLDIFSLGKTGFFGIYTLITVGLAFFIRLVIRKYVQFPIFKRVQKQKNPFYIQR